MSDSLPTITRVAPASPAPDSLPALSTPKTVLAAPSELEPLAESGRDPRWTSERQVAFLRELAASHNVALAARAVGMSRQSAYRLRSRLKGQPFDRAWAMAFGCALDTLAEAAIDRALNGIEVPHFHKGELIGTSRRFDERLTLALLAMRGSLMPLAPVPSVSVAPRDFSELLDRVEHGPERWEDDTVRSRRRR